ASITTEPTYRYVLTIFPSACAMIVIGSSFGQSESKFEDAESFAFLVELLKAYPKPVFVVSPHPQEVASLIEAEVKRRTVWGVAVRWEPLAAVIGRAMREGHCTQIASLAKKTATLIRWYFEEEGK